jgi:phosphoribosylanthranilate isomerase
MPTWIKFCGTTCLEDAQASIEAGANAIGFIFAPSKRHVTIAHAREIVSKFDATEAKVERIGVFVDSPLAEIHRAVAELNLTGIQLHGGNDQVEDYDSALPGWAHRLRVIRTIVVDNDFAGRLADARHAQRVDQWLLDSGAGSGKTFDWQAVRSQLSGQPGPFIIAGGLRPENVAEAIRTLSPWGVDVVSGIEQAPGRKDLEKMKAFVAAVRKAEQK